MNNYWDSFDCEIQCEEIYWNEEEVPSNNGLVRGPFKAEMVGSNPPGIIAG